MNNTISSTHSGNRDLPTEKKRNSRRWPMLILVAALSFTACQQQDNEQAIKQAIDDLHNQAMTINEKAIKAKFRLDSLLLQKRQQNDRDTLAIQNAIGQLNNADEKMMDWMHDFQLDFKGSKTEALNYFRGQLDSVKKVQQQLESAVEAARPFTK